MNKFIVTISILILVGLAGYWLYPTIQSNFSPPGDLGTAGDTYRLFLEENSLSDPIDNVRIVITKSNRILYLLSGDADIAHWKIALGSHPTGTKTQAGDGRTPVGNYSVCLRDRRSSHHLSLVLTYPDTQDADRALGSDLINDHVHQEIYLAANQSKLPPQDTPLGGDIAIHGGGTSRDWTNGSIAVENDVIEILWGACPDGTPVTIYENFTDWELSHKMLSF